MDLGHSCVEAQVASGPPGISGYSYDTGEVFGPADVGIVERRERTKDPVGESGGEEDRDDAALITGESLHDYEKRMPLFLHCSPARDERVYDARHDDPWR